MPRLEPVQLSKLNPAGLISSGAVGTARIGAGAIQTPRAADARQTPFVRQNSALPLELGERTANVAEAIQAHALKRAAAEGKAQGSQAAMQLYERMSTSYYGSDVGDFGISGLQGSEFLQASRMWEHEYKTQRDSIAASLGSYAAAEFIDETEKYRQSMLEDVRKNQATQFDVFRKQTNVALASANAHLIAKQFANDPDRFTLSTMEEIQRRLEADGHPYGLIEQEPGVFQKVYPEELRLQYMGRTVVDIAESLALHPEGSAVMLRYVETMQNLVADPALLKRLQDLPGEIIDAETEDYERAINLEKAINETQIRAEYASILTSWHDLKDPTARKTFRNDLFKQSPDHYAALKSVLSAEDYESTPADADFLVYALNARLRPTEAVIEASKRNVHINTQGMQQIISNSVARTDQQLAGFDNQIEVAFGRVIENTVGPDNFEAAFFANFFGKGTDRFYLDTIKIRWNQVAQKTLKAEGDLDTAFAKFVSENLNPDILNDPALKPDLNRSTLPQHSSFQRFIPKDSSAGKKLYNSYTDFTGVVIANTRTNLDTPLALNDSVVTTHAKHLQDIAVRLDKEADKGTQGNPRYTRLAKFFWEAYADAQKLELRDNNPMSYTPTDWNASIILEAVYAKQRIEKTLQTKSKTEAQKLADEQAKALEQANKAAGVGRIGGVFEDVGKIINSFKAENE